MFRAVRSSLCPLFKAQVKSVGCSQHVKSQIIVNSIRLCTTKFNTQSWYDSLDEAQQKRIRHIQNEVTLMQLQSKPAPNIDELEQHDYEHMLTLSNNQRQKYYTYLFKTQCATKALSTKREIRQLVNAEKMRELKQQRNSTPTGHIEYGLGKGALIPKVYRRTIDNWKNTRALWQVVLNKPKLIFDCGFSHEMTSRENKEAAKQLTYCFGLNRSHQTPFVLHFCNMNLDGWLWGRLKNCIPTLTTRRLPIQIHPEDYMELFPREKICVLTPDAPTVLKEYDPDVNYVISAIVDRGDKKPITLAKAKRLDIQTARLPLELYRTCRVDKTLTLDQMMQVMLEIKYSGDWHKAFQYVAKRKFV